MKDPYLTKPEDYASACEDVGTTRKNKILLALTVKDIGKVELQTNVYISINR